MTHEKSANLKNLDTDRAPRVVAASTALPGSPHPQDEIQHGVEEVWTDRDIEFDRDLLGYFFDSVGVGARHLALPVGEYATLQDFTSTNDAFVRCATDLGTDAIGRALSEAGVEVEEVDSLFFTTVTGVASPSIDARIMNQLELPRDCRRVPMFGLGCVGGAATMARAADHLRGHPEQTAVVLAVELCSLTLERDQVSTADYIAAALFGDGAAAVVLQGARADRQESTGDAEPEAITVRDSRSVFYRDREWVMGWEIGTRGFDLVLSGELPSVITEEVGGDLESFLSDHDLETEEIQPWLTHPGGPKVIEAFESAAGLDAEATRLSRDSLRELGNLSSVSVLDVLKRAIDERSNSQSEQAPAVLSAMGPGFCAEFVLLDW